MILATLFWITFIGMMLWLPVSFYIDVRLRMLAHTGEVPRDTPAFFPWEPVLGLTLVRNIFSERYLKLGDRETARLIRFLRPVVLVTLTAFAATFIGTLATIFPS